MGRGTRMRGSQGRLQLRSRRPAGCAEAASAGQEHPARVLGGRGGGHRGGGQRCACARLVAVRRRVRAWSNCGRSWGSPRCCGNEREASATEASFERALFAMVANRCLSPYSKLYCWEQWMREEVFLPSAQSLQLHHLYFGMDFLEEHKAEVEKAVYFKMADLMNADVDVIFYDTTSLHFEVDEEDVAELRKQGRAYEPLRKRGHSKNGRGDAPRSWSASRSRATGCPCARGSQAARCPRLCDAGAGNERNRGGRLPLSVPRTVPRGTWAPSSPARRRTMSRSRRAESLSRLTESRSRPAESLSRLTERLSRTESRSHLPRASLVSPTAALALPRASLATPRAPLRTSIEALRLSRASTIPTRCARRTPRASLGLPRASLGMPRLPEVPRDSREVPRASRNST